VTASDTPDIVFLRQSRTSAKRPDKAVLGPGPDPGKACSASRSGS
jgi:hypothetical protein